MATNRQQSSPSSSSLDATPAEISRKIKALLKELPEVRADAVRLDELRKLFGKLEAAGELTLGGSGGSGSSGGDNGPNNNNNHQLTGVARKWRSYLLKSHKTMVDQLCDRVRLGRHASIRCLWGVMAGSPVTVNVVAGPAAPSNKPSSRQECKILNVQLLQRWMRAMIHREASPAATAASSTSASSSSSSYSMDQGLRHMVEAEFLRPYRDVQYYSLGVITNLATETYNKQKRNDNDQKEDDGNECSDHYGDEANSTIDDVSSTVVADRLLELLMMIPMPNSEDELEGANQFLLPLPENVVPDEEGQGDSSDEDDSDEEDDNQSDDDDSDNESSDEDNDKTSSKAKGSRKKESQQLRKKFAFQQLRMFRREYQKAWLAVLRLQLSTSSLKKALHFLPSHVLEYVHHPLQFSDFFMQAYSDHETGGIVGVLALDGLFLLITEYELEYPNFYKQLYKLVSARVMHVKYRTRFFALLTKCLIRNEMLPGHLVAAFVKRLCRCALNSPPPAILFVLALVSNLLRKHPECGCLVHRANTTELEDAFDAEQDDPVKSCALQSSLWELAVLERHYYPAVATLAKSIGRPEEVMAPSYNVMGDFAQHTYASLFDQERKRHHPKGFTSTSHENSDAPKDKKRKTALAFTEPTSLFSKSDVFADCLDFGPSS